SRPRGCGPVRAPLAAPSCRPARARGSAGPGAGRRRGGRGERFDRAPREPMKIVHALGWYHPEALGGTAVYVAALCRRLRDAGHEVLVAAPDPSIRAARAYAHDGVPVYRYPIPLAPTRPESQGAVAVRGAADFHAWLGAARPAVVHFHSVVTGLGLAEILAARRAGARVIVTAHTAGLGGICQRGTLMRWGTLPCDGVCRPATCAACALDHRGVPQPLARVLAAIPPRLGRVAGRIPGRAGTA